MSQSRTIECSRLWSVSASFLHRPSPGRLCATCTRAAYWHACQKVTPHQACSTAGSRLQWIKLRLSLDNCQQNIGVYSFTEYSEADFGSSSIQDVDVRPSNIYYECSYHKHGNRPYFDVVVQQGIIPAFLDQSNTLNQDEIESDSSEKPADLVLSKLS